MLIAADAERRFVHAIFTALGATDEEAATFADAVTEADLRGYGSHGLLRVPDAANLLRNGTLQVGARPRVERQRERAAAVLIDGDRALGPYATIFAMREAMTRARQSGAATVGLHNCGHITMAGYYVELAAREDLIGILITKGNAAVHPHGGAERQIGTNPLSIAIPTAGEPFLFDMATSATTLGALRVALSAGQPAPPNVAVDKSGAPTTDPAAALAGALSPMGGAKGYGLGLTIELLAGALTGAGTGNMRDAHGWRRLWGTLIVVLDPTAFIDLASFKRTASAYLAQVKQSRRAPGVAEILIPGERSFRRRREQLEQGVYIEDGVWDETAALGRELGIDANEYA